ncbi:TetR/AcrR family transcriptional regulator [Mycobacterium sp. MYCO198283]|uniref:TetR/AcrR family transcriptional regulator n=1 Tax=Mycobacterium sp. MYCO198283 TaxID=2883505 RepID=UPI001E59E328|nr:TetR/AcrR family transcriptional regulator [Mycobacterium sp. MYCO198283]MCG5434169.1 TetR/AcrR family transcriptional regulator [Mycobacterium sp. MYCO198283]
MDKPWAARSPLTPAPRTAAQSRILAAALDLIAEHGVSGTSLQMIADRVGVTKAAVYHQFRTKDEIVIAVTEDELTALQDALDAAEAEPDRLRARSVLLTRVVEVAVARRRWVVTLQHDPVIIRLLGRHEPFQRFIDRLYRVLLGEEDATAASMVRAAIFSAVIGGTVSSPIVADIPDAELRDELLTTLRRLLELPG